MATLVSVDPLESLPYVFSALGSGSVQFLEVPSTEEGKKFEIYFAGNPVNDGSEKKSLVAFGEFDRDSNTAFRGALIASLVAIREGFNIHVGDYSYTKMITKHSVFAKVQIKLKGMRECFDVMASAARAFLSICFGIIQDISKHGRHLPWIQATSNALSAKARETTQQLKRSQCAVQMSAQCCNMASDPGSFFEDVEPPMGFNPEASFFVVRAIFEKVMRVVNGSVPEVRTRQISVGTFQSQFVLDNGGLAFHGDRCTSELAARCDVMLRGLRHVDVNSSVEIRDLTYDMLCVMRKKMDSFDAEMGFLVTQADAVKQSVMVCHDTFGDQCLFLQSALTSVSPDERCADGLAKAIDSLSKSKGYVEAAYEDICLSKITFDELEAN